jgi:hypothetical protein
MRKGAIRLWWEIFRYWEAVKIVSINTISRFERMNVQRTRIFLGILSWGFYTLVNQPLLSGRTPLFFLKETHHDVLFRITRDSGIKGMLAGVKGLSEIEVDSLKLKLWSSDAACRVYGSISNFFTVQEITSSTLLSKLKFIPLGGSIECSACSWIRRCWMDAGGHKAAEQQAGGYSNS